MPGETTNDNSSLQQERPRALQGRKRKRRDEGRAAEGIENILSSEDEGRQSALRRREEECFNEKEGGGNPSDVTAGGRRHVVETMD